MSEMKSERFGQSVQDEPRFGEELSEADDKASAKTDETIQGQIVRSTPFRFGIKSLAGLTLIAALVFASISFLGPLWGLSLSFGISIVILWIVFFIGMFGFRSFSQEKLSFVDEWFVRFVLINMLLFFGAAFAGGGQFAAEYLGRAARAEKIANELGFEYVRIKKLVGRDESSLIQVTATIPGGEFERVGVKPGDVIVYFKPNEFFQFLSDSKGEKAKFKVNNVPLNEPLLTEIDITANREIVIDVPEF